MQAGLEEKAGEDSTNTNKQDLGVRRKNTGQKQVELFSGFSIVFLVIISPLFRILTSVFWFV